LGIIQYGKAMKFLRLIGFVVLVGLSSIVGYSQNPIERLSQSWQRTVDTKFPNSVLDNDLYLGGLSEVEHVDYFVSIKDVNLSDRKISPWLMKYDYKDNTVSLGKWEINRDDKKMRTLVVSVYNSNIDVLQNYSNFVKKQYIVPESIGEGVLDLLDRLEKIKKEK